MRPLKADLRPVRAVSRPDRTDLRPEMPVLGLRGIIQGQRELI